MKKMKNEILIVICILVTMTGAQAISYSPPTIELSGNVGEYLNATIYFSDVPTETLTGYEKWTTDGKTLDRSLKASDLGIELVYPKVVDVRDGKAKVDITARAERAGNYTGAIFYRTSGQTGIAAGTWIKINIADSSVVTNEMSVWQTLSNFWRRFWDYITGFFATAEASNVTMNTSVNIVPTPTPTPSGRSGGGGGGGSAIRKDTDGDGISDIREMITMTDWKDPCDPNPNCAACLATKPTITPVPTLVSTPTVVPQEPSYIAPESTPEIIEPPTESKEKSNLPFYGFCFVLVIVAIIFLVYRMGKKAIKEEEEKK